MPETTLEPLLANLRAHARDRVLAVLAFDGVLTEYDDDPDAVVLPPEMRERLRRLSAAGVVVAVISGRPVDDLVARTRLGRAAFHIGLHGLASVGPGFLHVRHDLLERSRARLDQVAAALAPIVDSVPGARLENKHGVIGLHTSATCRAAVWLRFRLLNAAADLLRAGLVRTLRGRQVLELLPNTVDTRQQALAAVRGFVATRDDRPVFTVYVAADGLDDDAIGTASPDYVVAIVGRRGRIGHPHLTSRFEVGQFLERLATMRCTGSLVEPGPDFS